MKNRSLPRFGMPGRSGGWIRFILVLGLAGPVLASEPARPAPPPTAPEELRESIQALMIVSMKKALDLTRDQERLVGPKVQQLLEERERFARSQRQTLREVKVKLRRPEIPSGDFRTLVAQLDQLEQAHRDQEARLRQEIDRSLNPRQQVQLRLFVPRFSRELMMRLQEARRLQAARPAPPGPRPRLPTAPEEPDPNEEFEF